jgi:hypothetical protein
MKLTEPYLDALSAIARKLDALNASETRMGLPALEDADWEWERRTMELQRRVQRIVHRAEDGRRPDEEMLTSIGAHVLAYLVALHRAELTDVASGDDGFPCIACRRNNRAPQMGGVCPDCERQIGMWDGEVA